MLVKATIFQWWVLQQLSNWFSEIYTHKLWFSMSYIYVMGMVSLWQIVIPTWHFFNVERMVTGSWHPIFHRPGCARYRHLRIHIHELQKAGDAVLNVTRCHLFAFWCVLICSDLFCSWLPCKTGEWSVFMVLRLAGELDHELHCRLLQNCCAIESWMWWSKWICGETL